MSPVRQSCVDRGGDGGGAAGGIAGDHGGGPVFPQGPGKGEHRPGDDPLLAGGKAHPPKIKVLERPRVWRHRPDRGRRDPEGPARSAVHQREATTAEANTAEYHTMVSLQVKGVEKPETHHPLGTQDAQQEIAHHGGREDQREGEHHIQHAFDQPGSSAT